MPCHTHPDRKEVVWRRQRVESPTPGWFWFPYCAECATGIWPGHDTKLSAWERDQQGTYNDIHHDDRKWRQAFPEPKYEIKERS